MSLLSSVGTAIKGFAGGFWDKAAAYLGYIAIGVAVALGVSAIWFYKQNTALHEQVGNLSQSTVTLAGKVTDLENNNKQQDDAIADLVNQRKKDGVVVQGLIDDYKGLSNETASTKTKIRDLERKSDEVKAYLSSPLPASVRSVLNGKDPAADNAPAGKPDGSVPEQHGH